MEPTLETKKVYGLSNVVNLPSCKNTLTSAVASSLTSVIRLVLTRVKNVDLDSLVS